MTGKVPYKYGATVEMAHTEYYQAASDASDAETAKLKAGKPLPAVVRDLRRAHKKLYMDILWGIA